MHAARLLAGLLGATALAVGCTPKHVAIDGGGVHAEAHEEQGFAPHLSAGSLSLAITPADRGDAQPGILSMTREAAATVGPLPIAVLVDGVVVARRPPRISIEDGKASVVEELMSFDAAVITTIDTAMNAVHVRLRGTGLPIGKQATLRVAAPRKDRELATDVGAYGPGDLPSTLARWVVVRSAPAMIIGAPLALNVSADSSALTADASSPVKADGSTSAELRITLATDATPVHLTASALAGTKPEELCTVTIEPTESSKGAPIAARVLVDAYPDVSPKDPIVWDDARSAERTSPVFDAIAPRTSLKLPAGKYVFFGMHGLGWSIVKRELTLRAGEAVRLPMSFERQGDTTGWVGCDFHVHAQGSFDAAKVSYEDRVKSLVGVGVECAAATEHDNIGDHAPAAKKLGVDGRFRALTGVELTTVEPNFGHFNVYPWPDGASIPKTKGTSPAALFSAVHAMKGDYVLQMNHPRLRTGDGVPIGALSLLDYDVATGKAKSPLGYRADYDAIEVFNGYQMDDLDGVRAGLEEWLRMLVRGELHVATGNSDSHKIWYPWAGFPRNLVRVGADWALRGRPVNELVDAVKKGRTFVSNGPLISLRIGTAEIGDEIADDGSLIATVEAQLTDWQASPKLTLYAGANKLSTSDMKRDEKRPRTYVASVPLPKSTVRTPIVAVVEVELGELGQKVMATKRAMAFTNPVWIKH